MLVSKSRDQRIESLAAQKIFQRVYQGYNKWVNLRGLGGGKKNQHLVCIHYFARFKSTLAQFCKSRKIIKLGKNFIARQCRINSKYLTQVRHSAKDMQIHFFFVNMHNFLHFFIEHPVFFLFCKFRCAVRTKFSLDGRASWVAMLSVMGCMIFYKTRKRLLLPSISTMKVISVLNAWVRDYFSN